MVKNLKIADLIDPKLIPDERVRYRLEQHKWGYRINIYDPKLIFIPNIVRKELKIFTPFSDQQRIAIEKFIINEWRKRKELKLKDNWIPSYQVECQLCKNSFANDSVLPYNKHYYCRECYIEINEKF